MGGKGPHITLAHTNSQPFPTTRIGGYIATCPGAAAKRLLPLSTALEDVTRKLWPSPNGSGKYLVVPGRALQLPCQGSRFMESYHLLET